MSLDRVAKLVRQAAVSSHVAPTLQKSICRVEDAERQSRWARSLLTRPHLLPASRQALAMSGKEQVTKAGDAKAK